MDFESKASFLHAICKEFLETVDYDDTIEAYNEELEKNNVVPDTASLPNQIDEGSANIKDAFMKEFTSGNYKPFWLLWNEHIPEDLRNENDTLKLEFSLQLYFAVFTMINDETRVSPVESSMQEFKHYLETNGASLSQTTEFVAFYALPFVPNPKGHPTFKELFEESWREDLNDKLTVFVSEALHSESLPYLYKLYIGAIKKSHTESQEQSNKETLSEEQLQHSREIDLLNQKLIEHEHRATSYFRKFTHLQGEYHNLIGISAELIDALEKNVRGEKITVEQLELLSQKLFGQTFDKSNNIDLTVPGTTSSLLRASLSNDNLGFSTNRDQKSSLYFPSLDFNKLEIDLRSELPPKRKALILQALIWRLTKSNIGEQRDSVITSYVLSDIFGCRKKNEIADFVKKIFKSCTDIDGEYLARLINTIASFTAGRIYLSNSGELIKIMLYVMMKSKADSLTNENILGGLQKLSLRRHVQNMLIDSAVIEWLLKVLEEPDSLSDYALEYTVALLMNLCLRTAGKKKCCLQPEQILKLLTDLLGYENQEIRPYINGTLYSILSLPSIKAAALHMGLEEILKCCMQDDSQDERQIRFIIKQLNTADITSDDDVVSDEEDEEDEDEEGDAVEAEADKEENVFTTSNERTGEALLESKYLIVSSSSSSTLKQSISQKKLMQASSDEPFTRPVTPARKPNKISNKALSNTNLQIHYPHVDIKVSQERPRTSSSKGSRKTPLEEAKPINGNTNQKQNLKVKPKGKNVQQAFTSRPKIPRTPDSGSDSGSRPTSSTEVPPLTRSVSPPRPSSSRGGSARSEKSNKASPR